MDTAIVKDGRVHFTSETQWWKVNMLTFHHWVSEVDSSIFDFSRFHYCKDRRHSTTNKQMVSVLVWLSSVVPQSLSFTILRDWKR